MFSWSALSALLPQTTLSQFRLEGQAVFEPQTMLSQSTPEHVDPQTTLSQSASAAHIEPQTMLSQF
jgi:hypothetical protein